MKSKPKSHRRRGPDSFGDTALQSVLASASAAVNKQLRSHRGWTVAAAAAVPVAVGLIAARKKIGMPPWVTLPLGCVPVLGCAIAVPKGRARLVATSAAYMHLFKLGWELPYDDPEKLRRKLWIDEPIRFDTVVGLGVPPGLRLQRALRKPGEISNFDRAVTVVYGSWFLPHILLGYLLVRHQEYMPRAGARLSAAYHLTCPFYFLAPEAPPWWACEREERMGGEIERVARLVVYDLLNREPPKEGSTQGNPWGAMPSDHISSAAITAMGLAEVSPLFGAIGWTYVAAASFAIVYLGEHYVADVVVGLLIAEAVHLSEPLAAPFVRAVARAVD